MWKIKMLITFPEDQFSYQNHSLPPSSFLHHRGREKEFVSTYAKQLTEITFDKKNKVSVSNSYKSHFTLTQLLQEPVKTPWFEHYLQFDLKGFLSFFWSLKKKTTI